MVENIKNQLRADLTEQAGTYPARKKIADYMFALIDQGNHIDIATEIGTKKKSVEDAYDFIQDKARKLAVDGCAVVEDSMVVDWAAEYLGVGTWNTSAVLTGEPPRSGTPEKAPEPAKNSVSLDLGLDDLFD